MVGSGAAFSLPSSFRLTPLRHLLPLRFCRSRSKPSSFYRNRPIIETSFSRPPARRLPLCAAAAGLQVAVISVRRLLPCAVLCLSEHCLLCAGNKSTPHCRCAYPDPASISAQNARHASPPIPFLKLLRSTKARSFLPLFLSVFSHYKSHYASFSQFLYVPTR